MEYLWRMFPQTASGTTENRAVSTDRVNYLCPNFLPSRSEMFPRKESDLKGQHYLLFQMDLR